MKRKQIPKVKIVLYLFAFLMLILISCKPTGSSAGNAPPCNSCGSADCAQKNCKVYISGVAGPIAINVPDPFAIPTYTVAIDVEIVDPNATGTTIQYKQLCSYTVASNGFSHDGKGYYYIVQVPSAGTNGVEIDVSAILNCNPNCLDDCSTCGSTGQGIPNVTGEKDFSLGHSAPPTEVFIQVHVENCGNC